MSIRPGRAKGPWVGATSGGGGGGAPDDATYITVDDESGDLSNSRQLLEGQATDIVDKGAGVGIEIAQRGLGFHDAFIEGVGYFWESTDALKSGDWSRTTGSPGYLEGIAQNNPFDRIRWGVMGDFDYAIHIDANTANSCGLYLLKQGDATTFYRVRFHFNTDLIEAMEGNTVLDSVSAGGETAWLRLVYRDGVLYWYYKINEADAWSLLHSEDNPFASWDAVELALDSANTARIFDVKLYDYKMGNALAQMHPMTGPHPFNSGNVSINPTRGNVQNIDLTGAMTLSAPDHPYPPSQMLLLRVRQDGTGGRTLAFSADFRFSSDLPAPTLSTDPDKVDYLGFIYDETDQKWDYIAEVKGF